MRPMVIFYFLFGCFRKVFLISDDVDIYVDVFVSSKTQMSQVNLLW